MSTLKQAPKITKPPKYGKRGKSDRKQTRGSGKVITFKQRSSPVHNFLTKHASTNFSEVDRKVHLDPSRSLRTFDRRVIEPLSEDSISLASSLLDPLTVYRFRLAGYTTLTQTTGVVNSYIATDPSAAGWNAPEWSNLTALFTEFRLMRFSVTVVRNFISISAPVYALAVASSLSTAANPGSYATIANFPDVRMLQYTDSGRSPKEWSGNTITMQANDLGWSILSSPTATPYAGSPGCIMFYANGGSTSGNDVYQIIISGEYEFRSRA